MGTWFNTQTGPEGYKLQFSTENKGYFGLVQSAARHCVDGKKVLDFVPVVRCRDCKFSREPAKLTKIYGEPGTLTCAQGPCNKRNVSADFFCGYGKKK